jgi:hypothetical protein
MIQHYVTFTLPEDQAEFDLHLAGPALQRAVIEFKSWLRSLIKHGAAPGFDIPTLSAVYTHLLAELEDVPQEVL